jgi:hypothetical protein
MCDDGGDPACWLGAVCDLCGAVIDLVDRPHRCRVPVDLAAPERRDEQSESDGQPPITP